MADIRLSNAGGVWNVGTTWDGGVVPTSSDNVFADVDSGNLTIPNFNPMNVRIFNLTDYAGTITNNFNQPLNVMGNTANYQMVLNIPATTTLVGEFDVTLGGANGLYQNFQIWQRIRNLTLNMYTGINYLYSPLNVVNFIRLDGANVTLMTNNYPVTAGQFICSGDNHLLNLSYSTVTLDKPINNTSYFSFNTFTSNMAAQDSTVICKYHSPNKQIVGTAYPGIQNFGTLILEANPDMYNGAYYFGSGNPSNTSVADLRIQAPNIVTFEAGSTRRINKLTALGTDTEPIKLKTSSNAQYAVFTCQAAVIKGNDYLEITDIYADTTNTIWYAGENSQSLGISQGWTLESGNPKSDGMMLGFVA